MSYRRLKRLLGETNFELKTLALFGTGLTVLAVITTWLYWWRTSALVDEQNRRIARLMVSPIIIAHHWRWDQPEEMKEQFGATITRMTKDLAIDTDVTEKLSEYEWELFSPDTDAPPEKRAMDQAGADAARKLKELVASGHEGPLEFITEDVERGEIQYFIGVRARKSCIDCHRTISGETDIAENSLIGVVKVPMPMTEARNALDKAFAFVISAQFVLVVLAILGVYLVIRYVITKPVMHLKRVSDAVAQGNLDMRADIRTGDEFEELSHAFNRMLRHLVTIQEELKDVNTNLDTKIDQLAQVNLRLYEMNNLKNEFLASMSHELRTPLNSILGFSDILASADNIDERQQRFVDNIQSSGRHLLALINDVLDLAKIESGKMELHATEISVTDLVERRAATMAPLAEKKNIELSCHVADDLPLLLQDAGKLQQILNNLLSNAIKFTPEGGRVRVRAERHGVDRCDLVVEDNGVGIPLEDQERIFEKFRQGTTIPGQDDLLTREFEGTGLGLSIVRELTRLLGGEVLLDSEFGKGSTFRIRLPIELDAQARLSHPVTVNARQWTAGTEQAGTEVLNELEQRQET